MTSLDRTQAPPFRLSSDYSLIQPENFTLRKGQPLYAFRGIGQNVVKLEIVLSAGKWFEPKPGVSHFTALLLPKGTQSRTSFQIAEALESLGAHIEILPSYDTVTVSLFVLKKNLSASLQVVCDFLENPSFDDHELKREKDIYQQNLRISNEKPNVVASKEIRKALYGPEHPYGNSAEEPDVAVVDRDHVAAYFKERFRVKSAYLVGNLSDSEIDGLTGTLPNLAFPHDEEVAKPMKPGGSRQIKKPGSVQSSIRLGKRCLRKADDPAYYDAVLFNHVLGGFFGSRLMKNIREERGLTYGVYSAMQHFLRDSFWVIGAEVNQQNTEEALLAIRSEIKRLQEEPVPADELEVAKNYFIGSWQSENATVFAVAEKIRSIHQHNLPLDYYSRLLTHIRQATPESILKIAQSHFGASDLIEIQVG